MTEIQHRPSTQKEKAKQKDFNQKEEKMFCNFTEMREFEAPPFALKLAVNARKETANTFIAARITLKIIQEANFFVSHRWGCRETERKDGNVIKNNVLCSFSFVISSINGKMLF